VLGSTQNESDVDGGRCAAAGLEVVRRRSGGGAVVVRPGAQVWLDVSVPRSDQRFSDDVSASFNFLGRAWQAGLSTVLREPASSFEVVAGNDAVTTRWSRTLCFAGLGAGEVTMEGRKIVGISQRRDRSGAWFHSMALLDFEPCELPSLLKMPEPERQEATSWLAGFAAAIPGGRIVAPSLVEAVLSQLS
jgi:lipoate-protein ligase A